MVLDLYLNINISLWKPKKVTVKIPDVLTTVPGRKFSSPEDLDLGFPIKVETTFSIGISNVLFIVMEKRVSKAKVLYPYALPEAVLIDKSSIIRIPWMEVFKAANECLRYEESTGAVEQFYIAVYDHFKNKWYRSSNSFRPLSLWSFSMQCDPKLDAIYKKTFGFSIRELTRAKTSQERLKILGISEKTLSELIELAKAHMNRKS